MSCRDEESRSSLLWSHRGDRFVYRCEKTGLPDAREQAGPGEASSYAFSHAGDGHHDVASVEFVQHLAQRARSGEVDIAHADGVEHNHVRSPDGAGQRGVQLGTEVDRVCVPQGVA